MSGHTPNDYSALKRTPFGQLKSEHAAGNAILEGLPEADRIAIQQAAQRREEQELKDAETKKLARLQKAGFNVGEAFLKKGPSVARRPQPAPTRNRSLLARLGL